jgi:hypothetical protein
VASFATIFAGSLHVSAGQPASIGEPTRRDKYATITLRSLIAAGPFRTGPAANRPGDFPGLRRDCFREPALAKLVHGGG